MAPDFEEIVLDANVIVAAALSRDGAPAQLVERWLLGEFELVVSPRLLGDLTRALAYPKIRKRLDRDVARQLVSLLDELAEHVPDPTGPPSVRSRDPGGDYLLGLAEAARAILVTGDSHLLELAGSAPVEAPRAFLERLGSRLHTRQRIERSARPLRRFPRLGRELRTTGGGGLRPRRASAGGRCRCYGTQRSRRGVIWSSCVQARGLCPAR